jgi:hypothetical protein
MPCACLCLDDGRAVGIYAVVAEPALRVQRVRHHPLELIDRDLTVGVATAWPSSVYRHIWSRSCRKSQRKKVGIARLLEHRTPETACIAAPVSFRSPFHEAQFSVLPFQATPPQLRRGRRC